MVITLPAPNTAARSVVIDSIARLCMLVGFPVWAAARLAACLVLPLRSRRSRAASTERGSSACGGAVHARVDRTQLRSLRATTSLALRHSTADEARVASLPDGACPITHHRWNTPTLEQRRGMKLRARRSSTTFSHRRAASKESPWSVLPAAPHEARNSHQCEPARDAGRDHRGRPVGRAPRRPPRSPADGRRHLPR